MASTHNFRKLAIWKEGIEIAEGTARGTNKHFIQYLENALGSAYEWETQLIILFEVGYINFETYKHLETKINKIQAMISKFIDGLDK